MENLVYNDQNLTQKEGIWTGNENAGHILFLVPDGTYFHLEPPHAVHTRLRKY